MLDDSLDDPVLARCIASFDQNEYLVAASDEVALEFHQLDLKEMQVGAIVFLADRRGVTVSLVWVARLRHGGHQSVQEIEERDDGILPAGYRACAREPAQL
jgi:hypothetical protein